MGVLVADVFDLGAIQTQLIQHESIRLRPYVDTVGKVTIGVGRNLTDKGISIAEARYLLGNDVTEVEHDLDRMLPWWRGLDGIRQRVLADMCFNLGPAGLMKFSATLGAIHAKDYARAAMYMLDSKWSEQVGRRARRLAKMMELGVEVSLAEVK